MLKKKLALAISVLGLSFALGCGQLGNPPLPTLAVWPTATASPTVTPTALPLPTATPIATATPIPGWEKFAGDGGEIWLPESYEGGNYQDNLETIVARLRQLGFEDKATSYEEDPTRYAIWAMAPKVEDSGFLTTVSVTSIEVLAEENLETYVDFLLAELSDLRLVGRETLLINNYPTVRLVFDVTIDSFSVKNLSYMIKVDDQLWIIDYFTSRDDFSKHLPVFEQSALTFAVQP